MTWRKFSSCDEVKTDFQKKKKNRKQKKKTEIKNNNKNKKHLCTTKQV
jgi:hypothetical protein